MQLTLTLTKECKKNFENLQRKFEAKDLAQIIGMSTALLDVLSEPHIMDEDGDIHIMSDGKIETLNLLKA